MPPAAGPYEYGPHQKELIPREREFTILRRFCIEPKRIYAFFFARFVFVEI